MMMHHHSTSQGATTVRRSSDVELRRFAYECAWHLSLGMGVDEIVEATGKSRPTIYRAIEQAKDLGWLSDRPRLTMPPGNERDEMERYVTDRYKAKQVRDVFGSSVRPTEVIVVPAPPETPDLRLRAAICRAIRHSGQYQKTYVARDPDWAAALPQIVDDVARAPGVAEAVAETGADAAKFHEFVVHHVEQPFTWRDYERAQRVGRAAAERFCRALDDGVVKVAGLSWGYHVYAFATAVAMDFPAYGGSRLETGQRTESANDVQLFPLIGSLALAPSVDTREFAGRSSANANCVTVAKRIGAPEPVALTQPAAIPAPSDEADQADEALELRTIWRYVQADWSVQMVFGKNLADRRISREGQPVPDPAELLIRGEHVGLPPEALIARADTLVSGIGACTWDSRAPRLGLISLRDFKALGEEAQAVGDLSGQFFWDPLLAPTEPNKEQIRRANAHIISPRLGEFILATRRAKDEGRLGTVVLASGKRKANAVKAACNWGAVNVLIVDSDLADALCDEDQGAPK